VARSQCYIEFKCQVPKYDGDDTCKHYVDDSGNHPGWCVYYDRNDCFCMNAKAQQEEVNNAKDQYAHVRKHV